MTYHVEACVHAQKRYETLLEVAKRDAWILSTCYNQFIHSVN